MNEIITEILRWATAICFIYVGYIVCIKPFVSLRNIEQMIKIAFFTISILKYHYQAKYKNYIIKSLGYKPRLF